MLDDRATDLARRANRARNQSGRKRMVDPCTTDIIYESDEVEYMMAVQRYIKESGRKFPTSSEYLRIAKGLGYRRPETTDTDIHY